MTGISLQSFLAVLIVLGLVAALPEPVQVLEDDPVTAADAGVLRHVDHPQRAAVGAHLAVVEPVAPALPEVALRVELALPRLERAGLRLEVDHRRLRHVQDAVPGLPRAQAQVDVLVGHPVALVEPAELAFLLGIAGRDFLQVRAGAKVPAGAGEYGDGSLLVGVEGEESVIQFARGGAVHRVADLRAIDGDDGHRPLAIDNDGIFLGHWRLPGIVHRSVESGVRRRHCHMFT